MAGMDMSVHETAKLAAEAIQKELKAEEMEEKEELERERQELGNMGDQMKMEMTAQMLKAEVEGDMTNCGPNKDALHREAYCNRIYGDDWVQNKSCRGKENFC